jgi:inward rectifier potassium channel
MKKKFKEQDETEKADLGFGTKVNDNIQRLLNRDGSFNVKRSGLSFLQSLNSYHTLISLSWFQFNMVVLLSYIVINTVFALIYYFIGIEHMAGVQGRTEVQKLIESFFFSAQTLTTVGYGRISPVGFMTSAVAAIESLTGLLGFALATGLLYGRFSRPIAKILWSDNILVAPYKSGTSLQFRIANGRSNQLIETEVRLSFREWKHITKTLLGVIIC